MSEEAIHEEIKRHCDAIGKIVMKEFEEYKHFNAQMPLQQIIIGLHLIPMWSAQALGFIRDFKSGAFSEQIAEKAMASGKVVNMSGQNVTTVGGEDAPA